MALDRNSQLLRRAGSGDGRGVSLAECGIQTKLQLSRGGCGLRTQEPAEHTTDPWVERAALGPSGRAQGTTANRVRVEAKAHAQGQVGQGHPDTPASSAVTPARAVFFSSRQGTCSGHSPLKG